MKKLIYILLILTFSACTKEKKDATIRHIDIDANYRINDIYFLNQNIGFAVGGDRFDEGYIFKTINGGQNWNRISDSNIDSDHSLQTFNSIDFLNDSIGQVVGHGGKIARTTDGGDNWSVILNGNWDSFYDVKMFSSNKTLLLTAGAYREGSYYASSTEWYNFEKTETLYALRDLEFINNQTGYSAGYGYINKTTNGGNTWKILDIKGDYFFNMDFINQNTGYVCAWEGGIYKTQNGGDSWNTVHQPNKAFSKRNHFENIDFINENTGVVCGYNGVVLYTNNGGGKWYQIKTGIKTDFHSIYFLNQNTVFVGGSDGVFIEIML